MASMEQNLSRRGIISYSQLSMVTMFFCPTTRGGIAIAELSAQVVYQNTDWVLRGATQEEISNKKSKLTINADRKFNDYSIFDYEGNLSALSI